MAIRECFTVVLKLGPNGIFSRRHPTGVNKFFNQILNQSLSGTLTLFDNGGSSLNRPGSGDRLNVGETTVARSIETTQGGAGVGGGGGRVVRRFILSLHLRL